MKHLTLQQLSAALDDALVGVSLQIVRRHLAACGACRARHEGLAARDLMLARLVARPTDDAWLEDHAIAVEALIEADAGGTPGGASPSRAEPRAPHASKPPAVVERPRSAPRPVTLPPAAAKATPRSAPEPVAPPPAPASAESAARAEPGTPDPAPATRAPREPPPRGAPVPPDDRITPDEEHETDAADDTHTSEAPPGAAKSTNPLSLLAAELSAALAPPVTETSAPAGAAPTPTAAEPAVTRVERPAWGGVKIEVRRANEAAPAWPEAIGERSTVAEPTHAERIAPPLEPAEPTRSEAIAAPSAPGQAAPPESEADRPARSETAGGTPAPVPAGMAEPERSTLEPRPVELGPSVPRPRPAPRAPRPRPSGAPRRERRPDPVIPPARKGRFEAAPLVTGLLGGAIAGSLLILLALGSRPAARRPSRPPDAASAIETPMPVSPLSPADSGPGEGLGAEPRASAPLAADAPAMVEGPASRTEPRTGSRSEGQAPAIAAEEAPPSNPTSGRHATAARAAIPPAGRGRTPATPAAPAPSVSVSEAPAPSTSTSIAPRRTEPPPSAAETLSRAAPAPPPAALASPPAAAAAGRTSTPDAGDALVWPLLCGAVVNSAGAPLPGARVEVADLGVSTRTDRRGRFCIAAPAGPHTLKVSAPGLGDARRDIGAHDFGQELRVALSAPPR